MKWGPGNRNRDPMGTPKLKKGPHEDPVPQMGTHVATVVTTTGYDPKTLLVLKVVSLLLVLIFNFLEGIIHLPIFFILVNVVQPFTEISIFPEIIQLHSSNRSY